MTAHAPSARMIVLASLAVGIVAVLLMIARFKGVIL